MGRERKICNEVIELKKELKIEEKLFQNKKKSVYCIKRKKKRQKGRQVQTSPGGSSDS